MVEQVEASGLSKEASQVLIAFYEAIGSDARIGSTHISLYMALFHQWVVNDFKSPVVFTARQVMPLAKIDSRATYHKCLRDLVALGYLRYIPSCNPFFKCLAFLGSRINTIGRN